MTDILNYAYQGEWTEALQNRLNQWFTKQSQFLANMEFEESLFRDFITVMVKDKRRSMNDIKSELQELSIDETQARDLAEDLGRVLKSVENGNNAGLSRALSTSRGPNNKTENKESTSTEKPNNSGNVARLLNSALQTSRADSTSNNKPNLNKKRDVGADDMGNKKPKHNQHQQGGHGEMNQKPQFPKRDDQSQSNNAGSTPAPGTLEYFEKMNDIAKKAGFQNAHEMMMAQQQMMSMTMMQGGPMPPAPFHMGPPPSYLHQFDPAFMGPPVMIPPHVDPHHFEYFPPHQQGYGYHQDPRFQGRGYQGRGGRGSGRGGRGGRIGGRGGVEVEQPTESAPNQAQATTPSPAPPAVDGSQVNAPPAPTQTEQKPAASAPTPASAAPTNSTQSQSHQTQPFHRGGRGENSYGRGNGGRFANAGRGPQGFHNSNPFVVQQTLPGPADKSEQAVTSATPIGGFGGRGVSGRGFAGRGRGQPAATAVGNKVWVRKTEQQS